MANKIKSQVTAIVSVELMNSVDFAQPIFNSTAIHF